MNWQAVKRFNFTYAIPGGAWLEDASGYVNWESASTIVQHLGADWYERQLHAQGWATGCWIDVCPPFPEHARPRLQAAVAKLKTSAALRCQDLQDRQTTQT